MAAATLLASGGTRAAENALDILAWPGYIERGASDKAYDWVSPFERQTGCRVNVTTAASSEEMVDKMAHGRFDVVTASGDASLRLVRANLVAEVDVQSVPNWAQVDQRLQFAPWFTLKAPDGRLVRYGVPFQWGPNVLAYDTQVFGSDIPRSWSVVFEAQKLPDGRSNAGRVQAYDSAISIADAALYLKSAHPELLIRDPFALKPAQYAQALELVAGQRRLVKSYWHEPDRQVSDFKAGAVAASSSWPYQVNALRHARAPVASTFPREGVTGWADTTMVGRLAGHPGCAAAWLNWSLEPKVQAAVAEWFGSNPAVPEACHAHAPGGTDFCAANGYARFYSIHFWKVPAADCQGGGCVPYEKWIADFARIAHAAR
jgi:putative spermidine/putrescine transport system substrate-binding protein